MLWAYYLAGSLSVKESPTPAWVPLNTDRRLRGLITHRGRLAGTFEREPRVMDKAQKLKRCRDCDNDFYNHGNNSCSGECWMLKDAKPETVYVVGTWTEWPDKNCWPLDRLSCWKPRRGSGLSKWRKPQTVAKQDEE